METSKNKSFKVAQDHSSLKDAATQTNAKNSLQCLRTAISEGLPAILPLPGGLIQGHAEKLDARMITTRFREPSVGRCRKFVLDCEGIENETKRTRVLNV